MSDIDIYKQQLDQIQQALTSCANDEDRTNLLSLKSDLEELIQLANLESKSSDGENEISDEEADDESDKKEPFKHLINEKCRAPFHLKWQRTESFHNAFIADIQSVSEDDEVTVKIFFLNPIIPGMKPCSHYLNNTCTYEATCKFSHGEIISYSKLQPYQAPNFRRLKKKCHVLVKTADELWKQATIVELSKKSRIAQVKFHNPGKTVECSFAEILPPIASNADDSSDLSTADEAQSDDESLCEVKNVFTVNDNFGEWEKHTKGFGSKMLEKLGYKLGTGLGKRSDGICHPVSAKIYIQGKSLDYNMEHNERKKRDTVEEKMKRQSLKQQKNCEKNYARNSDGVFDFLNNTICKIKPSSSNTGATNKQNSEVKTQTKAQLNLSNFKIEEDMKKVTKSLEHLRESSKRLSGDSVALKNINRRIQETQNQLKELERKKFDVNVEQKMRKDKNKLEIF